MQVVVVDDGDSAVQYQPEETWVKGGRSAELKSTTHDTCTQGSSFTLTFNGSSISVYGTISSQFQTKSSYTIDGGPPQDYITPTVSSITFQTLFFSKQDLEPREHTLIGSLTGIFTNTTNPSKPCYFIDYLTYAPLVPDIEGSKTPPLSSEMSAQSPSDPPSSTSSGISSSNSDNASPTTHSKAGPIVGIVFAVIIALLACAAMLLLWRRYKRMQQELVARRYGKGSADEDGPSIVVVRNAEYSRRPVPEMPSTAVFSSYYEPSDTPYSPTYSEKASFRPREPAPVRRNGSPERFGKRFSMASKASAMSRLRSLKIGAPPSTVPSSIVFAPPRAGPLAGESRVSIVKEKRYEFDEV